MFRQELPKLVTKVKALRLGPRLTIGAPPFPGDVVRPPGTPTLRTAAQEAGNRQENSHGANGT